MEQSDGGKVVGSGSIVVKSRPNDVVDHRDKGKNGDMTTKRCRIGLTKFLYIYTYMCIYMYTHIHVHLLSLGRRENEFWDITEEYCRPHCRFKERTRDSGIY